MLAKKANKNDTPIQIGIKTVAIGKKGSKSLPTELVYTILNDLKHGKVSAIEKGAFFGALFVKGMNEKELLLDGAFQSGTLYDARLLVDALCPETSGFIKDCCVRLLNKETFGPNLAFELGEFLFSNKPNNSARGLMASILRVRYETSDEYEGLLKAMEQTYESSFYKETPSGDPMIQIAEPFDGVTRTNLLTPLLAQYLQQLNYRVVTLCGRNSGPKFGNNVLDLAKHFRGTFIKGNLDLKKTSKPLLGWYLNQEDLSKPLDKWVNHRQSMIKRPFLATLERFCNPTRAQYIIASAFHAPYGERMLTICERARIRASIIVRNGMEGTISFPLKRPTKLLCSVKTTSGKYKRKEFTFHAERELHVSIPIEEKLIKPSIKKNAALVTEHSRKGQTGYDLFDLRVKATCTGIEKALKWINQNKDIL